MFLYWLPVSTVPSPLYLLLSFANRAVQSSCTFFFHWFIDFRFVKINSMGMAATLGETSAFSILTVGGFSRGIGHLPWPQTGLWRLTWC